jgi:signal transduction histidine kinase
MMHSLRFRLLLTFMIVIAVALGTLALVSSRATTARFEHYVQANVERDQRIYTEISTLYGRHLGAAEIQRAVEQIGKTYGERIVLTDTMGRIMADSAGELVGQVLDPQQPPPGLTLVFPPGAPLLDQISVAPLPFFGMVRPALGAREASFLGAVNQALILAGLAAGTIALLLALVLSRRILRPVEALTAAARKMEQGDLSQRVDVNAKDEIGELAHAFNAMASGLARVEQLRRNMVSDVAHELRTPLSNIRGYLEALQDGVAEPSPALIGSLHDEALLLSRLVDDLQDLALAEAGQLTLVRRPMALRDIVEPVVQAMQPRARKQNLCVNMVLPPDVPPVIVDAERIGQVLRNLLQNAFTHTPPGGQIMISATTIDAMVAVKVRDTGHGIAAEHSPYVFDRFYRADRSRSRATGGAGLGLAIVKQLVQAHGGDVRVASTLGVGTTFTFTVPVAIPPRD